MEIATITDHYLNYTPSTIALSNQFVFCVYMAARVLLLHWRHNPSERLTLEFWQLIQHLDAMSARWVGILAGPSATADLTAAYSSALVHLHTQCVENETFCINVPGYTTEVKQLNQHSEPTIRGPMPLGGKDGTGQDPGDLGSSNFDKDAQFAADTAPANGAQARRPPNGLSSLSQALTAQSVEKLGTRTN